MSLLAILGTTGTARADSAKKLFKAGQAAEARQDLETAYSDYTQALEKSPGDLAYKLAVARLRTQAAGVHIRKGESLVASGQPVQALVEFFRAREMDPANDLAAQDITKTEELLRKRDQKAEAPPVNEEDSDEAAPPTHLDPLPPTPMTLHATQDPATLYRTIGKIANLNVLVDPDLQPKSVTLDLKDVSPAEALRVLAQVSGTFYKPVTHNTIYVAADNRTKRKLLDTEAVRTFYLQNVSQQSDLNDVQTTLRNLMQGARLYAVQGQNAIVMRGTPDELLLAKNIIADIDRPKPEVLVDVYVMEVSRTKEHDLGLSPPTSLSVSSNSSTTLNAIGRNSSYSYSIGEAQAELLLSDSTTRLLQNPTVRALDGQKATLNIGEKYPYSTGSYTTATSSSSSAVETQFQYIDVGVKVEMTPTIHQNRDVTLKMAVEVSSVSGTETIDDVSEPIIAQQKAEETVRLKDGEPSVLAGLVEREVTGSVSGWPGAGEVPLLKYLFSTQDKTNTDEEIVFMLVPHIVRAAQNNDATSPEIDSGAGDTIQIQRIARAKMAEQTAKPATDAQPPQPAKGDQPAHP
ncbi:secretin N-terminal domain-containing protein [Silvibacterium dinghuense]|uniref:Type II and III secretion system protein n=1 Tax=Silvibacterium dinghuense TaxID=1560006 RepID=A0A4Q1SDS5_9BACT|nr:secretin N-terminal domain-containing protein [Silvibacterium dinghuense]RXS95247.1 type II and III secretion system protein [Silvibacterium dinghuense]